MHSEGQELVLARVGINFRGTWCCGDEGQHQKRRQSRLSEGNRQHRRQRIAEDDSTRDAESLR